MLNIFYLWATFVIWLELRVQYSATGTENMQDIMKKARDTYIKIRCTFRFVGFSPICTCKFVEWKKKKILFRSSTVLTPFHSKYL